MESDNPKRPSSKADHEASYDPEVDMAKGHVAITGVPDAHMKRNFSILSIIAMGYNNTNSWVAIAASFSIAIQSGGSVSLLYGIIVVFLAMLCTGITLAELASVYPTAGGQYHFTSILASKRWSKALSYTSGIAALFAWITLGASIALSTTNVLMAIVIRWQPEYETKSWHYFLVYQLLNGIMVAYNIFLTNKTLWIYNLGCKCIPSFTGEVNLTLTMTNPICYSPPLHLNLPCPHHHLSIPFRSARQLVSYLGAIRQRIRRLARRHLLPDRPLHAAVHVFGPRRHPPPGRRMSRPGAHRPQGSDCDRHRGLTDGVSVRHCHTVQLQQHPSLSRQSHGVSFFQDIPPHLPARPPVCQAIH